MREGRLQDACLNFSTTFREASTNLPRITTVLPSLPRTLVQIYLRILFFARTSFDLKMLPRNFFWGRLYTPEIQQVEKLYFFYQI
jgi:hypothetical protein